MRFLVVFIFIYLFAIDNNITESNITENNVTEYQLYDLNLTNLVEQNITEDIIDDNEYNMDIAIILDKEHFFQFIPNILNSINAYMVKKDINYHIKLFNKDANLSKITQNYKYIFAYLTTGDLNTSKYPDNYFFIPTLNKNQMDINVSDNVFFGGIDYRSQVSKLNQYISDYTNIIYDNSNLSKYITSVVDTELLQPHKVLKYPIRYTNDLNDTFIYLNTKIVNTAQLLSNFTYHQIEAKSILTTQIDYSPLLFSLTNSYDTRNLIIANSIININPIIEDNNLNLNSNINFNWLNFTTSTLLNVAYNIETDEDYHFLNDFNLYMFFDQVNYKTNLYKIYNKGFIKIEN